MWRVGLLPGYGLPEGAMIYLSSSQVWMTNRPHLFQTRHIITEASRHDRGALLFRQAIG